MLVILFVDVVRKKVGYEKYKAFFLLFFFISFTDCVIKLKKNKRKKKKTGVAVIEDLKWLCCQ